VVGSAWVAMTLTFELGWGHFGEDLSWETMLADHDLSAGRLWVLVPMWTALAPVAVRQAQVAKLARVPTSTR
jgi:hypothetical protein